MQPRYLLLHQLDMVHLPKRVSRIQRLFYWILLHVFVYIIYDTETSRIVLYVPRGIDPLDQVNQMNRGNVLDFDPEKFTLKIEPRESVRFMQTPIFRPDEV